MDVFCDNNHTAISIHIKQYLEYLKALKYSHQSLRSYKNALRRFISFLTAKNINRVADITIKDLAIYRLELVDQGYADHSIGAYLRAVRKLFKYLEDNQQIFVNPATSLIIPGAKAKLQPVPTESDMKKLLSIPDIAAPVGIRDRAIIETFYSAGTRLEELVRMNVREADIKQGRIKVMGKGSKERVVPLGRQAVFWIDKYLKEVRPVFVGKGIDEHALWVGIRGRRIHPMMVENLVREYGQKAKITCAVTPHALRRACATHMLKGGAHPVQIQLMLGHASLATLSQYLKITITDLTAMHRQGKPGK